MRSFDYGLQRCTIARLEALRSKRGVLLLLCMVLLWLTLTSYLPNQLSPEVNAATWKWTFTSVYLPAVSARIHEVPKPAFLHRPVCLIQNVVLLPEDLLLLLQLPKIDGYDPAPYLPPKKELTCLFNTLGSSSSVAGVDYSKGRALVRCRLPGNFSLAGNIAGDGASDNGSSSLSSSLYGENGYVNVCLLSGSKIIAGNCNATSNVKQWSSLVFEMFVTSKDVVLFAKGINRNQWRNVSPKDLVCVFGDGEQVIETKVTVAVQEVFRCKHPSPEHRRRLAGQAVTLKWNKEVLPTVVYYEDLSIGFPLEEDTRVTPATPGKELCSCTMINNVAKFLPEWGTFHSHVGVDRFILYDNNSDDELDEALAWLSDRHVQVTRYPWPWPKTQEAGFSHCAVATRDLCEWVLFVDVDEFVFLSAYLPPSGKSTPLRELITTLELSPRSPHRNSAHLATGQPSVSQAKDDVVMSPTSVPRPTRKPVGQISLKCRDFGPSNLTQHPIEGVTQGYVCRSGREERHKSLVKPTAIAADLRNVVHHFNILSEYRTAGESSNRAVINHYKFQAWSEFRQKFHRRASTFVTDWKDRRNLQSRDRTPGLGAREEKPTNWERRFCDKVDTALREYCRTVFSVGVSGTPTLTWQL